MENQIFMVIDPKYDLVELLDQKDEIYTQEYMNSTVIQTLQDYYGLPPHFLVAGIVFHFFGMFLQGFIIAYECCQIDPMEQNFTNMVIFLTTNNYTSS